MTAVRNVAHDDKFESGVLNVILSHQTAPAIERMIAWWEKVVPSASILIAYGGHRSEFGAIRHSWKLFVDDPHLRTVDHQRELQSYTKMFQSVASALQTRENFRYVHFSEFDHIPLAPDLNRRQIERLTAEKADVLGFHLHRVDGTSNAHFLYHASNQEFAHYWSRITCRAEPEVVLSMFGSGSFWKRETFCTVASVEEPFPIYMEIFLPTLAHHLGFRVRDYGEQDNFVGVLKDKTNEVAKARNERAWTLHPAKYLWKQ